MSSLKVLLCDVCIILLFGLTFVLADEKAASQLNSTDDSQTVGKGNCSCGGFPSATITAESTPLLSQTPGLEIKCDAEGGATCKSLCGALATATKAKGPGVLCNRLKDADELKLSAFYKVCEEPWTYADMTADELLCCENSKVKPCSPSIENDNSTDAVSSKTVM